MTEGDIRIVAPRRIDRGIWGAFKKIKRWEK